MDITMKRPLKHSPGTRIRISFLLESVEIGSIATFVELQVLNITISDKKYLQICILVMLEEFTIP